MSKRKKNKGTWNLKLTSIRVKLLLMLIVICQVPLITFGLTAYNKSNKILFDKLKTTSNQELELVNGSIDNYFKGIVSDATMLSNNVDFKDIMVHPEYEAYALGVEKELKESNNDIEQVIFATVDKKVIRYPEHKVDPNYDPTVRPWYKGAIENEGNVTFSQPYKSTTGNYVVSVSKTVSNNGSVIGVVSIDIDLSNISKEMAKIKIGNEGYVFISDAQGLMISHPDKSLLGGDINTKLGYWEEVKKNPRGFTQYEYNGEEKFASYSTNAITGWKIMASMKESELKNDTNSITKLLVAFFVIVLPINILVASLFSRAINISIKKLKEVFNKASAGDLTERISINSKDEFEELADSFNQMTDGICALIGNVKQSSDTINKTSISIASMSDQTANAIGDISKTIDQVASGSTEQARDIEDGVSELQSLVVKLQEISNQARSMNEISGNTDEMTKDGLIVMDMLAIKSLDTEDASDKIEVAVKDMSEASSNIKAITNSINEIAEQTNLLALNAAIEAARAGEAGRGFSIVADEIRKLAEQSTLATKDIEVLIDKVDDKSKVAVKAVSEAKATIKEQGEAVNKTKITFKDIADAINNLVVMINSVQSSIEDINKDKDSIMEKMQNLSAISEETAASTEEVSAATEEVSASMDEFSDNAKNLNSLSENLENDINKFKI
ncbi:methyl-accepting chemotaxis protein [Clostridium sp. YIM B02505]|uniref:Methyl-accepting chemotaxis protein n=1 Tax=Clostridium yunnanense TaxID=2800325 RepID=A0ABS1EVI1_9CLOT|nr:methyl-accepting chemotaxis protein [Clostridium yunnanense]MBK1813396.1 methyl-accepting chemotaxis protein [Clostridium yunnanense]